jgi:hypothetical protein
MNLQDLNRITAELLENHPELADKPVKVEIQKKSLSHLYPIWAIAHTYTPDGEADYSRLIVLDIQKER